MLAMSQLSSADEGSARRLMQFGFPAAPAPAPAPAPAAQPPANPVAPPPTLPPLIPGGISIIPDLMAPPRELLCNDYCVDSLNCPSSCALQTRTIYDPVEIYRMYCGAPGACAGSQYTFDFSAGGV